jgi:diguanylate cyclase (GGDEF)-like protein
LAAEHDFATRIRLAQRKLRRDSSRAESVVTWLRDVNRPTDPREVAEVVVHRLGLWIPAAAVAVLRPTPGAPEVLAHQGLRDTWIDTARGLALRAMRDGGVRLWGDLAGDASLAGPPAVAAIALPLGCRGAAIAAVVAMDDRPSAVPDFAPDAAAALGVELEIAGTALDNALRLHRAEQLSVTDDLTQLYNSRYLNLALHRETKRAVRTKHPLALVFVDLDGFKRINDAHGHLFGSKALVEAGRVIRGSGRETDVVARFGGDEFALVLPDTGREGAVAVGARVRERIAAHAFLACDGLDIHLSASVGIATLPDVADTAEGLLHAADRAMYWVKDHGKNGIRAAEAIAPVPISD